MFKTYFSHLHTLNTFFSKYGYKIRFEDQFLYSILLWVDFVFQFLPETAK